MAGDTNRVASTNYGCYFYNLFTLETDIYRCPDMHTLQLCKTPPTEQRQP